MYEVYAVTATEALTLVLLLVAHGAVIGFLVRRRRLAPPRPGLSLAARSGAATVPEPPERLAA